MRNIICLVLVLVTNFASAEGFKSENEVRSFADGLMDQFVSKQFEQGLNTARPYWPIPDLEVDGLINAILQQWTIVDQRFGQAVGREFIKQERIAQSFLRFYYLHKFENHSIYWKIDFYKPRDEWKINSIEFLDALEPLFE